jgi:hypothetical protein
MQQTQEESMATKIWARQMFVATAPWFMDQIKPASFLGSLRLQISIQLGEKVADRTVAHFVAISCLSCFLRLSK